MTVVAQQIYETTVKNLPIIERLWLVKLVMDDLMVSPDTWVVDDSDVWSEEDYADLRRASLIGHCSERDWQGIVACLNQAIATPDK
ncbi:MAG: hypothetical protein HYR94_27085 [Chloroflexi bacterium]|nr:hypothetical protein [Chloroflexota bacterium]